MQERQITLGGQTYHLEEPYMVMATQNPIEQEGTYPLPEAQIDRFMFKLKITYPSKSEESEIMERMSGSKTVKVNPVAKPEDILKARETVRSIYVDDKVKNYIVNIVCATRDPGRGISSSLCFSRDGSRSRPKNSKYYIGGFEIFRAA